MTNRSRLAEIFNPTSMDKLSSDHGFGHTVFPMPLYEVAGEEIMSPQLSNADFLSGGERVENHLLIK